MSVFSSMWGLVTRLASLMTNNATDYCTTTVCVPVARHLVILKRFLSFTVSLIHAFDLISKRLNKEERNLILTPFSFTHMISQVVLLLIGHASHKRTASFRERLSLTQSVILIWHHN